MRVSFDYSKANLKDVAASAVKWNFKRLLADT